MIPCRLALERLMARSIRLTCSAKAHSAKALRRWTARLPPSKDNTYGQRNTARLREDSKWRATQLESARFYECGVADRCRCHRREERWCVDLPEHWWNGQCAVSGFQRRHELEAGRHR